MKIAVTYENGQIFQHFGHTEQFKIYEIEDNTIISSEVIDTNGQGHGALAGLLKTLGADVFRYCYALNNITCSRTTPPSIKPSTFSTIGSSPKIYVPVGSGEAYRAAQYWSDYASIIEEKEM